MSLRALFVSIPFALLLTCPARAQEELPTPVEMAKATVELMQKIEDLRQVEQPTDAQKAERKEVEGLMTEFVAGFDGNPPITLQHYVEVSSAMLQGFPRECIQVSEAGLKRFPDARFLFDHVGFARLLLTEDMRPSARRLAELEAARTAFERALQLTPDTPHAHMGLFQVQRQLGQPQAALDQLDACLKLEGSESKLPHPWLHRCGLLLQAGKGKEALALLQAETIADDAKGMARIMTLRAHALAGNAAKTQEQVKALLAADQSDAATAAAVDALLHLDKKADALKLLQQRPAQAMADEPANELALRKQAFAAFEAIARNGDMSPATPLRPALTKALGHRFLVMDPRTKDGKPVELDLSTSPVMMSQLLSSMPAEGTVKTWANDILFALCLRAIPGYKAPAAEAGFAPLLQGLTFPTAADLPAILLALRTCIVDPEAPGALIALRVADKLTDKKPPPAKK